MSRHRTIALAAVIATAAVAPAGSRPTAAAEPPVLRPIADLYVSSSRPARNFGRAHHLLVGRDARAYLRFALGQNSIAGRRVVLYVYPLRDAPAGVVVRHASEALWLERRVTQRTAPRMGRQIVRSGPLRAQRWRAIDVTSLVNDGGVVALALTARGRARIELASREAGTRTPRLVLFPTAGEVVTPPAAPPGVATPPAAAPVGADRRPTPEQPCGVTSRAPRWEHVAWIVMENTAFSQVIGAPDAPFVNAIAGRCGLATSFFGTTHPSLPNYIAMTSGSTQGVTRDVGPAASPLVAPSIFSQLGGEWRSLHESMTANCSADSGAGYAAHHNPALYFTDLAPACATQDVPLGLTPDLSARFTFIVPNNCHNMHDCGVSTGDAWLAEWLPRIFATPQYRAGTTAVFLTFDEDDGHAQNHIVTLVMSPSTPAGARDGSVYGHASLLRTTEDMLGLPPLADAASMRAAFNL